MDEKRTGEQGGVQYSSLWISCGVSFLVESVCLCVIGLQRARIDGHVRLDMDLNTYIYSSRGLLKLL